MDYKIIMNLQLFAEGEKTEKPTPKKRKDTRDKGQVVKSREINSALLILIGFVGLKFLGKSIYNTLSTFSTSTFTNLIVERNIFTIGDLKVFFIDVIVILFKAVGPILVITFVIGLVVNYMQVGFLFSTKSIQFKLSRINPIDGFKKIFSIKSLVELIKSMIKIFLIGYVCFSYAKKEVVNIYKLYDMDIINIVKYIGSMITSIAIRVSILLIVVGVLDYFYQKWEFDKNIKMTKQEIKEENKQSEGDPQVKGKIKEKQRQMAMSRMMADVPKADVIITNPTHYAIALRYDKDKYDAPFVLAKGVDLIAQNIKKIGKEKEVPIVENKPLARSLYDSVEIGQIIPEELFQAVAEVLAYIYSLNE